MAKRLQANETGANTGASLGLLRLVFFTDADDAPAVYWDPILIGFDKDWV